MRRLGPRILAALSLTCVASACGTDEDCPGGCQRGYECQDGWCVALPDPCDILSCLPGYTCDGGICVQNDPCDDVLCPNTGDICQNGVCLAGEHDADSDGYVANDDCDDTDQTIHPDADELCNGVNDDCDSSTVDGSSECEELCCGDIPSCQECCDASDCGDGWLCSDFECVCSGLIVEDRCVTDADCAPLEVGTETDTCGWCGTLSRSRTCDENGHWGGWSAWSDCEGEGVCESYTTNTEIEDCGMCGLGYRQRSAVCSATCLWSWATWSSCTGDLFCTESDGSATCPGDTGFRSCPTNPEGLQRCTCGDSGSWTSCAAGCLL